MFKSEAYTLHDNTTIYGHIITAGELVVKSQYIFYMKVDTNWYWNQQPKHHLIIVPTRKIIHPQLEFNEVIDFHAIHTSVFTRTQKKIYIKTAYMFD